MATSKALVCFPGHGKQLGVVFPSVLVQKVKESLFPRLPLFRLEKLNEWFDDCVLRRVVESQRELRFDLRCDLRWPHATFASCGSPTRARPSCPQRRPKPTTLGATCTDTRSSDSRPKSKCTVGNWPPRATNRCAWSLSSSRNDSRTHCLRTVEPFQQRR